MPEKSFEGTRIKQFDIQVGNIRQVINKYQKAGMRIFLNFLIFLNFWIFKWPKNAIKPEILGIWGYFP